VEVLFALKRILEKITEDVLQRNWNSDGIDTPNSV